MTKKTLRVSIQTKLTLSFLIMLMFVSGLVIYSSRIQSKEALKDSLIKMAMLAASQVDGDALASIKPGDENTKKFITLRDQLRVMEKSNPDIKYLYTFKVNDKKEVEYVVDADWGFEKDACALGYIEEEDITYMAQGVVKPVSEKNLEQTEWGVLLSGYAPVKNKKGGIVGAVGIDMTQATVLDKQQLFGFSSNLVILAAMLFALLIIAMISMTMIKDINKLKTIADEISRGKADVQVDIKRNDEIGELADSFSRMTASLKILMMSDEEEEGGKKG